MEINYIGHSCFVIKGKNVTLGIDPFDAKIGLKEPKFTCDVLLLSHDHFDHAHTEKIAGYHLLITGPGEYESQNVFIYGYPTFHDDNQGKDRGKNTIYLIEIDGFKILHLGDLGHELSKETLEKIDEVDVLLIPVGGTFTIDAETATKVISSLEPGIVVPMHYQTKELDLGQKLDGVDKFLTEMGTESPKKSDKIVLNKESDIPEETEVVVLTPLNGSN